MKLQNKPKGIKDAWCKTTASKIIKRIKHIVNLCLPNDNVYQCLIF